MKKFRWQLLIVLVTGLVVGLLLFFQQAGPTPLPVSTPSPISGGIYTEALVGNFLRLNPLLNHFNQADQDVNRLLFSSLIRFDSNGLPKGDLADSWTYSEDGARYTFSLNPNAVWHDGIPVSSQDILFTVSLLQSNSDLIPKDLRTFWPQIRVQIISDTIIEFTLPEGFAPFLDYLNFQILPSHLLGNLSLEELVNHPFNVAPIGSGPYRFSELLLENDTIKGVDLIANEYYFQGRPFIDEIVFQYYPTSKAALDAYLAGEVDGLSEVSQQNLMDVLKLPGLNVYSSRIPKLSIIFINHLNASKPFLQQAEFRKGLLAATNRQAIIDEVYNGQAVFAQGPILPDSWAYYAVGETQKFDPDLAKQKFATLEMNIDETGILRTSEGVSTEINLLVQDDQEHLIIAEIIKKNWAVVGIEVVIVPKPYEEVLSDLDTRNYEVSLVEVDLTGTPDPDPYPFWAESQADLGQNYSQWNNVTASEYLEQARVIPDIDTRIKLYRNFQVLFAEDQPSLPLFYPIYSYAVKETVQNINLGPVYDPSDRFNLVHTWYILTGNQAVESTVSGN